MVNPIYREHFQRLFLPSHRHIFQMLNRLEGLPVWLHCLIACLGLLIIAVVDYVTGTEIHFFIFYALPIAYVSWFLGRRNGSLVVLLSALIFWWVNVYWSEDPRLLVIYWNLAVRILFFLLVSQGIGAINKAYEYLQQWAETDPLTGLKNRRIFFEQLDIAMARCRRAQQPLTLAYIDLDHFKQVNDQLGHGVGDELLVAVSTQMLASLRKSDLVARLGGDEFAVLLEGNTPEQSEQVLARLQAQLLQHMQQHQWPVTFSTGAVTVLQMPDTPEAMVHEADQLMYEVKRSGRGRLSTAVI